LAPARIAGQVLHSICQEGPELHWKCGYPSAVMLMLLLSVALFIMFKRRKWL